MNGIQMPEIRLSPWKILGLNEKADVQSCSAWENDEFTNQSCIYFHLKKKKNEKCRSILVYLVYFVQDFR